MAFKNQIPNFLTSMNLLCGCLAILSAFSNVPELSLDLTVGCYLLFIAAIFDFLDGFSARLLNAHSPIGKELDSLADVVSFGVAPSMLLTQLINSHLGYYANMAEIIISQGVCFLIPIFSAYRLAKFNLDERQKLGFIGLPTPPNALLIACIVLVLSESENTVLVHLALQPGIIISFCVLQSFLLVSSIPFFSLKIKLSEWRNHLPQLCLVACSIVFVILFGFGGGILTYVLYLLMSLWLWIYKSRKV